MHNIDLHAIYRVGGPCDFLKNSILSIQNYCTSVIVVFEPKDKCRIEHWRKGLDNKVEFIEYPHEVLNFNDRRSKKLNKKDPRLFDNFTNYALSQKRNKWIMLIDDDMIFEKQSLEKFLERVRRGMHKFDCFPYFGLNVLEPSGEILAKTQEIQPADHALFFNYVWVNDQLDLKTGMEILPHTAERFKHRYFSVPPIYLHMKLLRSDSKSRSSDISFLRDDTLVADFYEVFSDVKPIKRRKVHLWKIKYWVKLFLMSIPSVLSFVRAVRKILKN